MYVPLFCGWSVNCTVKVVMICVMLHQGLKETDYWALSAGTWCIEEKDGWEEGGLADTVS